MTEKIKSPISEDVQVSLEKKRRAVLDIDSGIQQQEWALEFMREQMKAIPEPKKDAKEEEKQAYAREKVKLDAKENEIERQKEYREFVRSRHGV